MSSLVFPSTLPGFSITIERTPYTKVNTQRTVGGRRLSSTWWTQPLYHYRVGFNVVRGGTWGEFQKLCGFWARHFGGLDSFLLNDPDDRTVTAHAFGKGDGATTVFQLQRTLSPDADLPAVGSRSYWPAYSDGYEPVKDLNGTPSIYVGGTPTTPSSIGATGAVTFSSAPANASILTWTGNYYRRVIFSDEGLPMSRIVTLWYEAKAINLESVK